MRSLSLGKLIMDWCHPNAFSKVQPPPPTPLRLSSSGTLWLVSSSRLWILLSHFLILELPKIALTGYINGLLLASSWLLQIFGSKREGKSKKGERIWKSSAHRFSQEIASLFDSLPESAPPVETALQMLLLYADYKEGALYEKNIYFGPVCFRAVVLSERRGTDLIFLPLNTLFHSLPVIFLD